MKRMIQKGIGVMLMLVLAFAVFFGTKTEASAAAPSYIKLNDIKISDGQYLKEGTSSPTSTKPASDYLYYKSGILYLNNFNFEPGYSQNATGFYIPGDVTIDLTGTSSLWITKDYPIYNSASYSLTFQGSGTLNINATSDAAIRCGYFVMNGGTVNVTGNDRGAIYCVQNMKLNNGTLTVNANGSQESPILVGDASLAYVAHNMTVTGGTLTVTNLGTKAAIEAVDYYTQTGGTVTVNAKDCAIYAKGASISGGTLKLDANAEAGMSLVSNAYTQSGGNVTINSTVVGIHAQAGAVDISGGNLAIKTTKTYDSFDSAIITTGNVSISGGAVNIEAAAGCGITATNATVTLSNEADFRVTAYMDAVECKSFTVDRNAKYILLKSTNTASDSAYRAVKCTNYTASSYMTNTGSEKSDGSNPVPLTVGNMSNMDYVYIRSALLTVNNIGMGVDDYLSSNGTAASTYNPGNNYAKLTSGTVNQLELKNFNMTAEDAAYAIIATSSIQINLLEGSSTLTAQKGSGIYVITGNLEIAGNGRLTIRTTASNSVGINVPYGNMTVKNGITLVSADAEAVKCKNLTVEAGEFEAQSTNKQAILYTGKMDCGGLDIKSADTTNGDLYPYIDSSHNRYKRIKIGEHLCNPYWVYEVPSTCTQPGKKAHCKCFCGKYYEDLAGSKEIVNFESWGIIPPHTYASSCDMNCDNCGLARITGDLHTFTKGDSCTSCGLTFADVKATSWQINFVNYAVSKGLMAGKGSDAQGRVRFDPNSSITREEFVQVLYNAEDKPSVSIANAFPDVKDNGWYKNAVLWANSKNIANGLGDGSFGVGKSITRQDLALMLYKYAKMKGYKTNLNSDAINRFADGNKVSGYAETAMNWAVTHGILSGKGTAGSTVFYLDPAGKATRAECAAMLKNFMTAFGS